MGEFEKYRRPERGRTVVFRQHQGPLEGQETTDSGVGAEDIRQVIFIQEAAKKEEGELSSSDPEEEDTRQVVFRQEGGGRRLAVDCGQESSGFPPRAEVEILLEAFEGPQPTPALAEHIRQVGIRRREGGHERGCHSCARLSVAVPGYVRRCELRSVEERELFIDWNDFVAVPGREFLKFFQGALDQL